MKPKPRRGQFEREARIMAILLTAIIVIGVVAGVAVLGLSKLFGWHVH